MKLGLPLVLVNPWRVRRFGEGLGVLAKTDPLDASDARALRRTGANAERRPLPGLRQRETGRSGKRRRRQLIAMIVAEKSRLDNRFNGIHSSKGHQEHRRSCWSVDLAKLDQKDRCQAIDAKILSESENKKRLHGRALGGTRRRTGPDRRSARTRRVRADDEIASLAGARRRSRRDSGKKSGYRRIRAGQSRATHRACTWRP